MGTQTLDARIAGLAVQVRLAGTACRPAWLEPYACAAPAEPDLRLELCDALQKRPVSGAPLYRERGLVWYRTADGYGIEVVQGAAGQPLADLWADAGWRSVAVGVRGERVHLYKMLAEIAFRSRLLFFDGLVIHAAAVKWRGKGILFAAPSETGKSTQARLWQQLLGAAILNEDRPALCVAAHGAFIGGTPWSGASNASVNERAPLSAIFLLSQDTENRLQPIKGQAALEGLAPRCFLPYFSRSLMDRALQNLETVLQQVPVYRLACRPDEQAVRLAAACLAR